MKIMLWLSKRTSLIYFLQSHWAADVAHTQVYSPTATSIFISLP